MGQGEMNEQIYKFQLGDFSCWAIQDENGTPPVRQSFPDATDEELQRCGFEPEGTIELSYTVLLIDTGKEKILCDTGNGVDTGGEGRLFAHLQSLGISRESI